MWRDGLALDRSRWVSALGCVCALAFAVHRLPMTADNLLALALELQTPQGGPVSRVYGTLQGRPTEACEAFAARERVVLGALPAALARIKAATPSEISRVAQLVGVYNRDVRSLFLTPPADPACWKEDLNYDYFQVGFSIDSPFIWAVHRLGLSTIDVVLALVCGSWLGLVCLFLAARRLTGSAICGLLSVAVSQWVWDLWMIRGGTHLFAFNAFVPLYAGQLLSAPEPIVAARRRAVRWTAEGLVIGLVALHSLLQVFVYPFTHRLNVSVILVVLGGIGLLRRDRRVLLRVVALAAAAYVVMQPYYSDSRGLYTQLTSLNLAAGEGEEAATAVVGLFERPTYLGLPNGDYAFNWIQSMDPYLLYTAPNLVVTQSLDHAGRTLLFETLFSHPGTIVEAVWKRLMIQLVYHRRMNVFLYREGGTSASLKSAVFMAALALFGVVCLVSIVYRSTWPFLWPPAALIGWHLFGVNTLFTMVHVHSEYVFSGLVMLLALTPAMAVCAWTHRGDPRTIPLRGWIHAAGSLLRRPRVGVPAGALLAGLLVYGIVYGVRETRKEIAAFWLWYPIHFGASAGFVGDEAWRSPAQLAATIRTLQALGHEAPGVVEMHGAGAFLAYTYQNGLHMRGPARNDPALQAQYKAEADASMHALYRDALAKAPDDPHFGSYALMFNEPDWPVIFRRALRAAPTHHHAAYMAWNLVRHGAPRDELLELIGIYETETARLLEATAASRPGYERRPAIVGAPPASDPQGELLRLAPAQSITLPRIPLRGAPKLRVGVYLDVREGAVRVTGIPDAAHASAPWRCTSTNVSSQTIEHYWSVDCSGLDGVDAVGLSVTAIDHNAVVVIRDYYPMFSVVRPPL